MYFSAKCWFLKYIVYSICHFQSVAVVLFVTSNLSEIVCHVDALSLPLPFRAVFLSNTRRALLVVMSTPLLCRSLPLFLSLS